MGTKSNSGNQSERDGVASVAGPAVISETSGPASFDGKLDTVGKASRFSC